MCSEFVIAVLLRASAFPVRTLIAILIERCVRMWLILDRYEGSVLGLLHTAGYLTLVAGMVSSAVV